MTLGWPAAIVIVTLIIVGVGTATTPAYRRSRFRLAEMKAKYDEQYQILADDYTKLAQDTRVAIRALQGDVARVATTVESIETMMREVS
jgi:hypothetical protein